MTNESDTTEAKQDLQVRRGMQERWSFIVLVFISVMLSVAVLFFGIYQVKQTQHKFCQLIVASLGPGVAPVKPDDPKAKPAQEKLYENYIIVHNLGHSLGCI